MAMTAYNSIDAAIQVKKFLTDVARQSIPVDVFESNSERMVITGDTDAQIPTSIYIKIDASANDAHSVVVPLMEELSGAETTGSTSQIGAEENIGFRSFTMFCNNVSHAIITERYGLAAHDYLPYLGANASAKMADLMGTYFKQVDGRYKRQALLTGFSGNLTAAPVSKVAHWAPNWFVPKIAYGSQPSWDDTLATMTEAIGDAIETRGSSASDSSWGDVLYLQQLEDYARTVKCIKPIDFGDGSDGYVVVLPSSTIRRLKDPTATTGVAKLGQLFVDGASFSPEMKMRFPSAIGKVGGLVLVSDPRNPTILRAGSNGSWTLAAAYAPYGRGSDTRSTGTDVNTSLVGSLLGAGALYEWNPEPFHWEYNYEEYDRKVGAGLFKNVGYQIPTFQKTGTADSAQNFGSIVLPLANPA